MTHLFNSESPAPDTVLMRVVHRIGMGPGCTSSDSRSVVRRSACSLESAGTARAALRVWRGSTGLPAILCCVAQLRVLVPPLASAQCCAGSMLARSSVLCASPVQRLVARRRLRQRSLKHSLSCDRDGQCARSPVPDAVLSLLQSSQQSQSIQTLLEAEKEAAKTVQQARQCQCTRLFPPSGG